MNRPGICLILTLLLASSVFAQDYSDALRPFIGSPGMGARALGMAGAYTAISDDYTATLWNPAGLTQMRRSSVFVSVGNLNHTGDSKLGGAGGESDESFTSLDGFGFAFRVPTYRGSLVWAVGRNTINRFDTAIQLEGEVTNLLWQSMNLREQGDIHSWTAALGVEVTPKVSFGAAANWLRGENSYELVNKYGLVISSSTIANTYNIHPSYEGFSLKLGGLYKAEDVRFGIAVTAPTIFRVEEDWNSSSLPELGDSSSGFGEYRLSLPFRFSSGIAVHKGSVLVSADLRYTDWSQIDFDSDLLADNNIPIDGTVNRQIEDSLHAVTGYSLGAEYLLPFMDAKVRFGVASDPSPYDKVASGDDDRFTIAGGFTLLIDRQIKFDVALSRTTWERTLFHPQYGQYGMGISEDALDNRLILSLSYRY